MNETINPLIPLTIVLVALFIVFGFIERTWPAVRKEPSKLFRKQTALDVCYWFFNPLITKVVTTFSIGMVIFTVTRLFDLDFDHIKLHGFGPIAAQPFGLIVIEMLMLGDIVGYWTHRAFHQIDDLWDIHAIHHSSRELDWLSAVRVHPLNNIITKTIRIIPFLLLGFPLTALAAYLPILTLFAIFLHSNVPLQITGRMAPLKYLLATPTYHRWHHASNEEAQHCNYAGMFPFIDWLFGTLYLPSAIPTTFGIPESVPTTFLGQMTYPFAPDRTVSEQRDSSQTVQLRT